MSTRAPHGVDLPRWIFLPSAVAIAAVHDLDADGSGVELRVAFPAALARVPGALRFIHKAIDDHRIVAHQVMRAHVAVGEGFQRLGEVGRGEMQDDELHAAVLRARGIRRIDGRAGRGAAGCENGNSCYQCG